MRCTIVYLLGFLYPLVLQGAQSTSTEFHEETLAELPAAARFEAVAIGSNRLAWVEKNNQQYRVFLDAKQQGGVYDQVKYLRFSPDEQHLAFVAKTGSSFVLIYDSQEHSEKYSSITYFDWQPHGSSLAYGACQEKKCRLVVDGAATGTEYEEVSYPQYSDDGVHIAYLGKRAKKWFAVLDGKEIGAAMDGFNLWGFSQHGGRFYVAARLKQQWTFVVDGSAGPGFSTIGHITFSHDGKQYAYAGAKEHGGVGTVRARGSLIVDGKEQGTFEGRGYSTWLSPDTPVSGVTGFSADFQGISNPQFSPEGKLVYAARRMRGDVAVFVGEQAGAGFDDIVSPVVFSHDARHVVYIARQGEDFVEIRDGQQGARFPGKRQESLVSWIKMLDDEDSSLFAYEIVRGGSYFKYGRTDRAQRRVVLGGQAGPEYNALGISHVELSKDRKHYGYVVYGVEGDRGRAVLDGRESRLYDTALSSSLRFAPESGSVSFLALDGQKLLRVSHQLDNEDHTRLPSHVQVSEAESNTSLTTSSRW